MQAAPGNLSMYWKFPFPYILPPYKLCILWLMFTYWELQKYFPIMQLFHLEGYL